MYTTTNYRSKKALKEAVADPDVDVTVFAPGLGTPPDNGRCSLEGPHFPEAHRWYANATIEAGLVTKVR
jgi:hypothetical protein